MKFSDFVQVLPDEVWNVFKDILPERVWVGNGRPPYSNRECLHGIIYVAITGISWEMVPKGFPSYKTLKRRLNYWIKINAFQEAWKQLADNYMLLCGINWDALCIDGAKHPSKKGAKKQDLIRSIVPSRELLSI